MKIVIAYSGGLDSLLMWKYAQLKYPFAEIIRVYIDIGHDYAWKELNVLDDNVIIENLKDFQATTKDKEGTDSGSIFIPGRNLLFVTYIACKYLPDEIWLGALKGEDHSGSTDKNEKFRFDSSELLSYVLSPFKNKIKVRYPFIDENWGKFELTQWGVEQGYTTEIINSSSCLSGEQGNCGTCVVCTRRAGIFKQLGFYEEYNINPFEHIGNYPMFKEMLIGNHYDEFRKREIIPALQLLSLIHI